jgi:hypothetical protein
VTAKVYSDNEQLMMERDALKREIGDSFESLTHQYRSSLEFTEELRVYIKEYIEKDLMEKQREFKANLETEIAKVQEKFEVVVAKSGEENKELVLVNNQLRTETEQ